MVRDLTRGLAALQHLFEYAMSATEKLAKATNEYSGRKAICKRLDIRPMKRGAERHAPIGHPRNAAKSRECDTKGHGSANHFGLVVIGTEGGVPGLSSASPGLLGGGGGAAFLDGIAGGEAAAS